ncbi:MAG: hypothetical protein ACPGU1_01915 [Myxococcota bacterium]
MIHHTTGLLLIALLFAGCNEGLPPREQITDLRVLGVRLSPPSATEGEDVLAEALVVAPEGETATLSWYACLAPISAGAYFAESIDRDDCAAGDTKYGVSLGQSDSASFTVPDDFMDLVATELEGYGFEPADGEMSNAVQGLLAVAGWYLQVTLIAETEAQRVEVQKRLVVTLFPDQNTNPQAPTLVLEEVVSDAAAAPLIIAATPNSGGGCLSPDSALNQLQDATYRLSPVNLPDPPESYPVLDFLGEAQTRDETLFYSWFSTVDGWSSPVTKSPEQHPVAFDINAVSEEALVDGEDGQPAIPIWVIVRDGRGGTSWCHERIPYRP